MSSQDPQKRGDPASRSEGSIRRALNALLGKRGRHSPGRRPQEFSRAGEFDWAQAVRPEARGPREEPTPQPERATPTPPETEVTIPSIEIEVGRMALQSAVPVQGAASSGRRIDLAAAEREEVRTIELEDLGAAQVETDAPGTGARASEEAPSPGPAASEPGPSTEDRPDPAARVDLEKLHHPSPDVRRETLAALRGRPEEAPIEAVAARLLDPAPEVRREAISVLEGTKDDAVLLLLLDAMQDPSEEVRRSAREAIRNRHSPSVVDLLRRELTIPARRRASARALAELGELGELIGAADADPETRWAVREAMDEAGATAGLIQDLSADSVDRRRIAAKVLGAIRVRDAVEPLIDRLQDPDPGVRIKAAGALGRIGDRRAVHALKRSLIWDPDGWVVVAMGNALRELGEAATGRTVTV